MLSFFPRGVLDEILNFIESVSEGFSSYSDKPKMLFFMLINVKMPTVVMPFPTMTGGKYTKKNPKLRRRNEIMIKLRTSSKSRKNLNVYFTFLKVIQNKNK